MERLIRFKKASTGYIEITNGAYHRVFERKEEPFKIDRELWPMLRRTGEFEEATPAAPAQGQQQQQGEEQQDQANEQPAGQAEDAAATPPRGRRAK